MPGKQENSRLTVLQNFKEINRIMTSNFLKNKSLEQKYKSRIPRDVLEKKGVEDQATSTMTSIMKKMHSPRNFTSPLRKIGSVQTYQNVSLARNLATLDHSMNSNTNTHRKMNPNMSSFMNHSSQFDKANASTIDGTNISVVQYTDGIQELDNQE